MWRYREQGTQKTLQIKEKLFSSFFFLPLEQSSCLTNAPDKTNLHAVPRSSCLMVCILYFLRPGMNSFGPGGPLSFISN